MFLGSLKGKPIKFVKRIWALFRTGALTLRLWQILELREVVRSGLQLPGAKILLVLVILLLAINSVAIWGIVYSGREAQGEVLKDLQLQAIAGARTLEAILASTRADFLFLTQSPPLSNLGEAFGAGDPMMRRWRRLDIEATLILFLTSHPEVERIALYSEEAEPLLLGGRRAGAPVLMSTSESVSELKLEPDQVLRGEWNLGVGGRLEALLSIPSLLQLAAPTQEVSLLPVPLAEVEQGFGPQELADRLSVRVPVNDPDWSPPIDWTIIWAEKRTGLTESLTRLTERYRITLVGNVLLMTLAAVLGVISVRQVRRGIALEVENRQQSQIRELERQAMHSERLASVGRMAAGIAHEINNPLEGMANYLMLLEEDIQQGRLESSLEFVGKIREGLKRTAGVTRRVLTFAEPGQKPRTTVDILKILRETVEFVRGNPLFRNVAIQLDCPDDEVPVKGNPVTLGQAFLNLLLNAAELQEGQGSIEISCRIESDTVAISVADRGPGIDESMLPRLFEPFSSGRGSTGLGLSICRSIVQQHDGEISAENRSGGGAVFKIRMPCSTGPKGSDEEIGRTVRRMRDLDKAGVTD